MSGPDVVTVGFKDATTHPSRGGQSICVSGSITVNAATGHNAKLPHSAVPGDQTALTAFIVSASIHAGSAKPAPEFETVQQDFIIAATLCVPADAARAGKPPSIVQLLTHGVGFDRFYWDFAPGYSYVDAATTQANHAVFFYDRLGVGDSQHPDSLTVQAPIQLELAHSLVNLLRNGTFSSKPFSKVIGVGHSFGSSLTHSLNIDYPSLLDAAILTGFSTNATASSGLAFAFASDTTIAAFADPRRFAGLENGYTCPQTDQGMQLDFFAPNVSGFDPAIVAQADAQKGTQTIGEMLSPPATPNGTLVAANWTKPIAVINGENDFPFCMGNCSHPTDQSALVQTMYYPSLSPKNSGSYLAPNAGHGLNLHFSAAAAYQYIQSFLLDQGF
ncbi:hypothetical protein M409DRAFT_70187 [Zasmidium cellare ATCC 36951]|uniref:AB hydrolase-1 domain-containing protein n=1 Tax=Zasmidium cellare ATCC 36951 TaxID=1080233 RepID=A0A6A6C6A0_ZASCE|nr:uncharacterized protein M409DRAFT_70187 [Zasmidium cellare ATCC 36951]KAF2160896.1 hypothetical protein M409DRAFT_70187 [Zasmidium cellare ATCC 36951]